jgi:hypothetical protein
MGTFYESIILDDFVKRSVGLSISFDSSYFDTRQTKGRQADFVSLYVTKR